MPRLSSDAYGFLTGLLAGGGLGALVALLIVTGIA